MPSHEMNLAGSGHRTAVALQANGAPELYGPPSPQHAVKAPSLENPAIRVSDQASKKWSFSEQKIILRRCVVSVELVSPSIIDGTRTVLGRVADDLLHGAVVVAVDYGDRRVVVVDPAQHAPERAVVEPGEVVEPLEAPVGVVVAGVAAALEGGEEPGSAAHGDGPWDDDRLCSEADQNLFKLWVSMQGHQS